MVTEALFVLLKAKTGRELDVENFLREGLEIVDEEPATTVSFALRFGPDTFGIFDAFPDEAGRQAHLSGPVAAALMEQAPELLAESPTISSANVLAAKLPGVPVAVTQVSTRGRLRSLSHDRPIGLDGMRRGRHSSSAGVLARNPGQCARSLAAI